MHDYEIIVELSEAPQNRLRMTELADCTAQSRSRLSHQITRMESKGLVVREGCEGDKRGTFAVLTERGADIIGKVAPHHVASVRQHFIDQLAPDSLAILTDACEPVLDRLRKPATRLAPSTFSDISVPFRFSSSMSHNARIALPRSVCE